MQGTHTGIHTHRRANTPFDTQLWVADTDDIEVQVHTFQYTTDAYTERKRRTAHTQAYTHTRTPFDTQLWVADTDDIEVQVWSFQYTDHYRHRHFSTPHTLNPHASGLARHLGIRQSGLFSAIFPDLR
jgi:hypothetical protein